MNRLPIPKEATAKPWTTWRQLRLGLVAYLIGLLLADMLEHKIYEVLGIWFYAGSFGLFPIVPAHLKGPEKENVAKKFVRNLRVVAGIMMLLGLTRLF